MDIYSVIGKNIRSLRDERRLSQDELAKAIGVSTNTISRWETATYKPSLEDLQKLAEHFKIRLSSLLPQDEETLESTQLNALLSATGDLQKEDIDELIDFAEWRRAKRLLGEKKKRR